MDIELNEMQLLLKNRARELSQKEFGPLAAEIDERDEFASVYLEGLKKAGFLGMHLPVTYGGSGQGQLSQAVVQEEIAEVSLAAGSMLENHRMSSSAILYSGSEEQRCRFLPSMASGENIGAFAVTESEAGSDVYAMKCEAKLSGNDYVINGTKSLVSLAGVANVIIILAKTDPKAISAFIVTADSPGFAWGKYEKKMGQHGICTGDIVFEDCHVTRENLLGVEGKGLRVALEVLNSARIMVGAQALGIAKAAYKAALNYAKQRVAFNKPIAEHQAIGFMLADMDIGLQAMRLMVYWAANLADKKGASPAKESAMVKVFNSEMAHQIVDKALQIHGGWGYTKVFPVERYYRDQRVTQVYAGTSEMMRRTILHFLLRE